MSRSSLSGLPPEIFNEVASGLDLRAICSLRLTSREVANKTTSTRCYVSIFARKTVALSSVNQVDEFVRMTGPGQMGRFLQHLTLKTVLPPCTKYQVAPDSDVENSNDDALDDEAAGSHQDEDPRHGVCSEAKVNPLATRLALAFDNLRLNTARGGLNSLEVRVERKGERVTKFCYSVVIRLPGPRRRKPGDWVPMWRAARDLLVTVSRALEMSPLPIEQLDLFGKAVRCSLACDFVSSILDVNLLPSISNLKSLSLSLSDHFDKGTNADSVLAGVANSKAICQFLKLCPRLETLELHWYRLSDSHTEAHEMERCFFDRLANSVQLPQLRRLTLKGITASDRALVKFFSHSPLLAELIMERLFLEPGDSFDNVFSSIVSRLDYVHLDDLYSSRPVCFHDTPGDPYLVPSQGIAKYPNHLTRQGSKAREPILWHYNPSGLHGLVSGNRVEYGPP